MGHVGDETGSVLKGQQMILTDCHHLRVSVVGNKKGRNDLEKEHAVINLGGRRGMHRWGPHSS